jgi:hypothetical protein
MMIAISLQEAVEEVAGAAEVREAEGLFGPLQHSIL